MKFYCDNCNTKYSIADDKVRGKVLKVRCKKCENIITVRENSVPAQQATEAPRRSARKESPQRPPSTPPKPAFDPKRVQWHYAINGQSFGPLSYRELRQKLSSGEVGDESYVWTESFSGWKPVREVEAFRDAVDAGQKVKPRRNTIGVSQALEAIKPEDFKRRQAAEQAAADESEQDGQVTTVEPAPQKEESSTDALLSELGEMSDTLMQRDEPEEPEADAPAASLQEESAPSEEPAESSVDLDEPDASDADEVVDESGTSDADEDEGRKDRLARLRQRLKSPTEEESADSESDEDAEPAAAASPETTADEIGATARVDDVDDLADEPFDEGGADEESEESDLLGPTIDAAAAADQSAQQDPGEHSGLFDDIEMGQATARADEADEEDEAPAGESDRIPFFPEAPELGSESGKVSGAKGKSDANEGITGSLLIQLDKIQKEGRGKKGLLIAAAVLLIGGVVGTGIYIASQNEPTQPVAGKSDSPEVDDDDDLVIRTYSDDEQSKIFVLGDQQVDSEEGAAEADDSSEKAEKKKEPTRVASKSSKSRSSKTKTRGTQIGEGGPSLEDALNSASKKGSREDKFRKGLDDGALAGGAKLDSPIAKNTEAFNSLSAIQSERRDPIYKPTDSLKNRKKSSAGGQLSLTRKQIEQGVSHIRKSVGICRQRHSRRGQQLDARKIYLTITVQPTGRVSNFRLAPNRVRNTEFERCMKSHRGRWKFDSFSGDAQKMRAPFILN